MFTHPEVDISVPYDRYIHRGVSTLECSNCGQNLGNHHGWECIASPRASIIIDKAAKVKPSKPTTKESILELAKANFAIIPDPDAATAPRATVMFQTVEDLISFAEQYKSQ